MLELKRELKRELRRLKGAGAEEDGRYGGALEYVQRGEARKRSEWVRLQMNEGRRTRLIAELPLYSRRRLRAVRSVGLPPLYRPLYRCREADTDSEPALFAMGGNFGVWNNSSKIRSRRFGVPCVLGCSPCAKSGHSMA